MRRPIRLYPLGDINVTRLPWLNIYQDDSSKELWIDFHTFSRDHFDYGKIIEPAYDQSIVDSAQRLVIYDFFHGASGISDAEICLIRELANLKPLVWITLNPVAIPGIHTIKFDFYWNRTKHAFADQQTIHKTWGITNYQQYKFHTRPREKKFLTYSKRSEPRRDCLKNHLVQKYSGFYNDSETGQWLLPNYTGDNWHPQQVAPPARYYYDESYMTCLIETQHLGTNSHLISEKTYDNLIQGRAVLNFATPGFYHYLQQQGWALPNGIDWGWDLIVDDDLRFNAYLKQLDQVLGNTTNDLHQWFLSNSDCWLHNQQMLQAKPYDIIDTNSIW